MSKKCMSLLLSAVLLIACVSPAFSASAASYEQQLKNKGFPDSYVADLVALHKKYPNWDFQVFNTGLKWSDAVAGERSPHSQQIIQKSASLGDKYYCSCSNCKKNGSYVIQYGSSCVSASEYAVTYYMDPRNWLDEKHIFQFESSSYDAGQTQSGVESIISSTWMKNANITYVNTSGSTVTYTNSNGKAVKYSAAIMDAAKNSGMSAYYIASRIVKEVGAKKPTATGVCGTKAPFTGMYNYYSIGANSNAMQGLAFAAGYLKTTKSTTLYSAYDSSKKTGSGTKTSVASGQYASYIGTYGDYYKVKLYNETNGGKSFTTDGKVGYILKSALRTTYFNYSRPWNNPYKAIYGGAKYIAESYSKYQNTGYLQKFNVNKASGKLYNHEYMANVDAVSVEAVSTYNAYKNAGILNTAKTFYIPVFSGMPGSTATASSSASSSTASSTAKVSGLKLKTRTATTMSFTWNKVSGASKYYLYITNNTKKTNFSKTVTTNSASIKGLTPKNEYSVKVRAYASGKWTSYSSKVTAKALPMTVSLKSLTSPSKGKIKATWGKVSGASGYQIYYARDSGFKKVIAKKNVSAKDASYTGKNFTKGVTYYVKVRAYQTVDGKKYYGSWSKVLKVKSK